MDFFEHPFWNLTQVYSWIKYRDPFWVRMEGTERKYVIGIESEEYDSTTGRWGSDKSVVEFEAMEKLREAIQEGRITCYGIAEGKVDHEPISLLAWSALRLETDPSRAEPSGDGIPRWNGLRFESKQVRNVWTLDGSAPSGCLGEIPGRVLEAQDCFWRRGVVWDVRFGGGRSFSVRDSQGMKYLAQLLASPGKDFRSLALAAAGNGVAGASTGLEGLSGRDSPGGRDEAADETTLKTCRDRLLEIEAECEDPRLSEGERTTLFDEKKRIEEYLAENLGIGGRVRTVDAPAEKARKAVLRAITDAKKAIGREDKSLEEHLRKWVSTGTVCRYRPPEKREWLINF